MKNSTLLLFLLLPFISFSQVVETPRGEFFDDLIEMPQIDRNTVSYFKKDGKYGFKKGDSLIFAPVFDHVKSYRNFYVVENNGKYGALNKAAELILPMKYDTLFNAHQSGNSIIAKLNNKYGAFDLDGANILKLKYNQVDYADATSSIFVVRNKKNETKVLLANGKAVNKDLQNITIYKNGIIASVDHKYGFIADNSIQIPFEYDELKIGPAGYRKTNQSNQNFAQVSTFANPIIARKGEVYSLINSKGEMLIPMDCDGIEFNKTHKYYLLKKGKNRGAYFPSSKTVIPIEYDRIYMDGMRYVTISKAGKKGIYTKEGTEVLPIEFDAIWLQGFNEGFKVTKAKKEGWYSTQGEVVIPIIYDEIDDFYESGFDDFLVVTIDEKKGIINRNHEVIIPINFEYIWTLDDHFLVFDNRKMGLIDKTGSEVLPMIYSHIKKSITRGSEVIIVKRDSIGPNHQTLYGICNSNGEFLVKSALTSIRYINNALNLYNPSIADGGAFLAVCNEAGLYGVFNEFKQEMAVPFTYDAVQQKYAYDREAFFILQQGTKYGIVNQSNEIIIPFKYDALNFNFLVNYNEGGLETKTIVANKNGKFGLINFKNETSIQFIYQSIERISIDGLFKAKNKGGYILIDQENKPLNARFFDEISQFENGTALTFKNGMMRTINKDGVLTSEPVKMDPHEGYSTFEDLKYGLITALEHEDDELLKAFVDKIAPSEHLLYFLDYNFLSRKQLGHVDIAYVKMRYLEELTTFKKRYYNSILFDKKSLTAVEDYTIYDGVVYTNKRTTDHTFGNVKYLEKYLRNSFKVNGYWISPYFMSHRFR